MAVGREPLEGEAVEKRLTATPVEDKRQLPSEILGIVEAGVQPLAGERTREVSGVAEKKAPPPGQARYQPAVDAKRRRPGDIVYSKLCAGASLDDLLDGRQCVVLQLFDLVLVERADERDPALSGQRREPDMGALADDHRHAVAGKAAVHANIADQEDPRIRLPDQALPHGLPA